MTDEHEMYIVMTLYVDDIKEKIIWDSAMWYLRYAASSMLGLL